MKIETHLFKETKVVIINIIFKLPNFEFVYMIQVAGVSVFIIQREGWRLNDTKGIRGAGCLHEYGYL